MSTMLAQQACRSIHNLGAAAWHASCKLALLQADQQLPCASLLCQQGFATAATAASQQQGLTLKSALRQLYKRVHPDLFTGYPAEQAENERSFKLLQDYLHQARTPSSGPASRTAYHFRFYLMPHTADDVWQEPPEAAESAADPAADRPAPSGPSGPAAPVFQLVSLSLVPPEPSRSGGGSLSPAASTALAKLLALCGMPGVGGEPGEQGDSSSKLTTFLPEAAEVVRQHESGVPVHEVRVANMRAALRLARQVIAGFQPGMFSGPQQVELLQRLAAALDLLAADVPDDQPDPLDLSGLRILICNRTCLDSQGTLCLDAADSAEDWADFLGGVDLEYARDKVAAAAGLRRLEAQVAGWVGVRMVFTAAHYLMTHEYRSFLERLAAHAADYGPVQPNGRAQQPSSSSNSGSSTSSNSSSSSSSSSASPDQQFSRIPVYVAPPQHHSQHQQEQQQQQVVHETMGYVMVHMDDSAQRVYDTIRAHGRAAADILTKKQQLHQEMSQLTSDVRARLGLRRLSKDELISGNEYRAACKRLLFHREHLLRCNIEGLSIRVSDRNRVAADGSLVDIAWNFEL